MTAADRADMKLFGLGASEDGARRLASELGLGLAAHEEREFEDGEFKIRPLESVDGVRVAIYQSLAGRAGQTANDKLMRALIFAGAVRDAGATAVTLVAPYLAFSRKDRRTKSRDPVSTRYLAQIVEAVGIDEIITMDVHNRAAYDNAFRIRALNVAGASIFVEHFRSAATPDERVVVVSPDTGGVKRARQFADLLTQTIDRPVDLAFVEKYRSEGRVSGDLFAGDVSDAVVIVVDDMIAGGTTMRRAAQACLERGARRIHAAATHGVFAAEAVQALGDPAIASVVVTDSICDVTDRGRPFASKLVVLPCAASLAAAIHGRR